MRLASDVNAQMLGGLGWRELILMAAIVLLLASASRLTGFSKKSHHGAEQASSRAYLDRLLGPARSRISSLVVEHPATAERKVQT
jgi:hypothetical protein